MSLKNAIARGEYARVDTVVHIVSDCFVTIRQRLLIFSGKLSDNLAGQSRDVIVAAIDREIRDALNELAEPSEMGCLFTGSFTEARVNIEAFRQSLIELGYTEGNSAGVRKTVVGFGRSLGSSTRVN